MPEPQRLGEILLEVMKGIENKQAQEKVEHTEGVLAAICDFSATKKRRPKRRAG